MPKAKPPICALVLLLPLLAACGATGIAPFTAEAPSAGARTDHREAGRATRASGFFGAAYYSNLEFERSQDGQKAETNFETVPLLGFSGQYALGRGRAWDAGMEGGLVFSGWYDDASVYGSGGTIVVSLDQSLLLTDLFFGGYVSTQIGEGLRCFGGVGPLMLFAYLDTKNEVRSQSDSSFAVGAYARAGLQFRLDTGAWFGLQVRAVQADLGFDDHPGSELQGVQFMLTLTKSL